MSTTQLRSCSAEAAMDCHLATSSGRADGQPQLRFTVPLLLSTGGSLSFVATWLPAGALSRYFRGTSLQRLRCDVGSHVAFGTTLVSLAYLQYKVLALPAGVKIHRVGVANLAGQRRGEEARHSTPP